MTTRLILARHGNTFAPQDEPVWVGARSDLPLVEKGLAQAQTLGEALAAAHPDIQKIITGPLQRTRQTAQIAAACLNMPANNIHIDPRLTEIDYGAWEGLSTQAIIAAGGGEALEVWNKHSTYPTQPGWRPSEAQLIANTAALLAEAIDGTSLIVTSNGILRFFARAALNAADFPGHKVLTGHLCVLERDAQDWRIRQWNQPPERFFY